MTRNATLADVSRFRSARYGQAGIKPLAQTLRFAGIQNFFSQQADQISIIELRRTSSLYTRLGGETGGCS